MIDGVPVEGFSHHRELFDDRPVPFEFGQWRALIEVRQRCGVHAEQNADPAGFAEHAAGVSVRQRALPVGEPCGQGVGDPCFVLDRTPERGVVARG